MSNIPLAGSDLSRDAREAGWKPRRSETVAHMGPERLAPRAKLFAQGATTINRGSRGATCNLLENRKADRLRALDQDA
jgi:hypothetical protein